MNPRYPIYIPSKGRAQFNLTAKALEALGVDHRVVVEPQEYNEYVRALGKERVLKLPFSNLGQGSIPARNWIWQHALEAGAPRHWCIDDNIRGFYRLNHNVKVPVVNGTIFRAAEDFCDRFQNIALAGFQYDFFCPAHRYWPVFLLNTRIYSCILLDTSLSYRWRGRYNEDTDLSLRVLKANLCTVLFCTFLAKKIATMTMKGGNSDELYRGDGRLKMAESLRDQHPEVVRISRKYGRWQHHVNYAPFRKNKLIRRPGVVVKEGIDNYGMKLIKLARG